MTATNHAANIAELIKEMTQRRAVHEHELNDALVALATDPTSEEHRRRRDTARVEANHLRQEIDDLGRALQHARELDERSGWLERLTTLKTMGTKAKSAAQARNAKAKELDEALLVFMRLHREYGELDQVAHDAHVSAMQSLLGVQRFIEAGPYVSSGSARLHLAEGVADLIQGQIYAKAPSLVDQARLLSERTADVFDRALANKTREIAGVTGE